MKFFPNRYVWTELEINWLGRRTCFIGLSVADSQVAALIRKGDL